MSGGTLQSCRVLSQAGQVNAQNGVFGELETEAFVCLSFCLKAFERVISRNIHSSKTSRGSTYAVT